MRSIENKSFVPTSNRKIKLTLQVKDRVDKNLVKENDNIRKYMQQMKVGDGEDHE